MKKIFYSVLITLTLFSCKTNDKTEIKKLARIYADLEIAREIAPNTKIFERKKKEIFIKNKITQAKYDSLISTFANDDEKWNAFFNAALDYIDSLKFSEISKKKSKNETAKKKSI